MIIGIFHVGTGNIGSIENIIKRIGHSTNIIQTVSDVENADVLIIPGVGSFDIGIDSMRSKKDLFDAFLSRISHHVPVLGICLGMQLLTKKSEEGSHPGLGLIPASTKRFHFSPEYYSLKVPHMGWNTVSLQKDCVLFDSMEPDMEFYFTHSYHLEAEDPDIVVGTTNFGYDFPSVIQKNNIYAVQFHPEKSHKYGMKLLQNFIELT